MTHLHSRDKEEAESQAFIVEQFQTLVKIKILLWWDSDFKYNYYTCAQITMNTASHFLAHWATKEGNLSRFFLAAEGAQSVNTSVVPEGKKQQHVFSLNLKESFCVSGSIGVNRNRSVV